VYFTAKINFNKNLGKNNFLPFLENEGFMAKDI
jgi:hypothetical protein